MIRKTARFQVRREQGRGPKGEGPLDAERSASATDGALAAIREFVAAVRREPGTIRYLSLQESQDPTRFLHYFEFRDEKAEAAHSSSAAVKRFTDVLYPLCVEPVEFTDLNTVATTEPQPS